MKTEFILHGHLVVLMPRQGRPPEVYIEAPNGEAQRYTNKDLARLEGQFQHKLDVIRATQDLLATAQLMATEEHAI